MHKSNKTLLETIMLFSWKCTICITHKSQIHLKIGGHLWHLKLIGLHIKWHWPSNDLDIWSSFSEIQAHSWILWIMKFYSVYLDLDPMTLVLKLDLDVVKMYVCTEMKFLGSAVQKL